MRNLLLPIDLYPDLPTVLKELLSYLQNLSGSFKLFLLATYLVPASPSGRLITAHDELKKQSVARLKQALQLAQELCPVRKKVSFETLSQMGSPNHVIARIAEEHQIGCVILAMNEKINAENYLWKHLRCPVLLVPLCGA